jgi:CxxC motif-containing protein
MEKINTVVAKTPVQIGDILVENIFEDAHLVATGKLK